MTSYVNNLNDFVLSFVMIFIHLSSRCVCLVYTRVNYILNNIDLLTEKDELNHANISN
jgi:hypothetical protein